MTDRVRLVDNGTFRFVLQDFSNVSDTVEALGYIARARAFMETQPRGTTLVLTDVSGSRFDPQIVDAMRELAEHHRPWLRASALVGLSPLMRVVYRAVVAITRREIKVCETREEALRYLATFGPGGAPP